jgi:hypothetical protein
MKVVVYPALWIVTALIALLIGAGVGLEWTASRLVPMQKFFSKMIEDRQQ